MLFVCADSSLFHKNRFVLHTWLHDRGKHCKWSAAETKAMWRKGLETTRRGQHSVKAKKESFPQQRVDAQHTYVGRRTANPRSGESVRHHQQHGRDPRHASAHHHHHLHSGSSCPRFKLHSAAMILCSTLFNIQLWNILCSQSSGRHVFPKILLITKTDFRLSPNGPGHLQRGDLPQRAVHLRKRAQWHLSHSR